MSTQRTLLASLLVMIGAVALMLGDAASAQRAPATNAGGEGWTGPSGQWSLAQREAWVRLERELDARTTRCGAPIVADYNHESFRSIFNVETNADWGIDHFQRSMCAAGINAMDDVCVRGEMQASAARARINRVTCAWGERKAMRINGSTLEITFNTNVENGAGNFQDEIAAWVTRQL